ADLRPVLQHEAAGPRPGSGGGTRRHARAPRPDPGDERGRPGQHVSPVFPPAEARRPVIVWDDWLLTAARAAIHLPTRTAVVADLHLGYAEVRRRAGEAVPLRPVAASLEPLRTLLAEQAAEHLVLAGDVFE